MQEVKDKLRAMTVIRLGKSLKHRFTTQRCLSTPAFLVPAFPPRPLVRQAKSG
jgi:hypothetical protein